MNNEIRAIKKLCNGGHENIVEVFGIGEFPDSSYVYIDMELCDLNLSDYIQANRKLAPVHDYPLDFIETQIWDIMRQIANGVVFIHNNEEVHRDLKPSNGVSLAT